jgi:hypothetical protein
VENETKMFGRCICPWDVWGGTAGGEGAFM